MDECDHEDLYRLLQTFVRDFSDKIHPYIKIISIKLVEVYVSSLKNLELDQDSPEFE
jgi:hypothetical protein